MIQEILTYFILSIASVYTLYSFFKIFVPGKTKGCGTGTCGCSAKEEIKSKLEKKYKLQKNL
jgi:hypothetical protein